MPMRVKDIALRTGLSGRTIRRWIADGKLAAEKDETGQHAFTEDHVAAILRVKVPNYRPITKYVLSLSNNKGGVGKTATAINLARELAETYSVLLVDFDPQANATEATVDNPDDRSFLNHIVDGVPLSDLIIPAKQFDVLPSHVSFSRLEMDMLMPRPEGLLALRNALVALDDYQIIIIDTPPSLGIYQHMALCTSNGVFVPVQAASFAINGVYNLNEMINRVNSEFNLKAEMIGIGLTMYDQRNAMDSAVKTKLNDIFGDLVFRTVIRRNTSINESMTLRLPVKDMAPKSYGAQDYAELAAETVFHVAKG